MRFKRCNNGLDDCLHVFSSGERKTVCIVLYYCYNVKDITVSCTMYSCTLQFLGSGEQSGEILEENSSLHFLSGLRGVYIWTLTNGFDFSELIYKLAKNNCKPNNPFAFWLEAFSSVLFK